MASRMHCGKFPQPLTPAYAVCTVNATPYSTAGSVDDYVVSATSSHFLEMVRIGRNNRASDRIPLIDESPSGTPHQTFARIPGTFREELEDLVPRRNLLCLASVVVCAGLLGCGESVPPADKVSPDTATDLGDSSSDPPGFGEASTEPPAAESKPTETPAAESEAAAPKAEEPAAEKAAEPEAAAPKTEPAAAEKPAEEPSEPPATKAESAATNEPERPEPPALPEPVNP